MNPFQRLTSYVDPFMISHLDWTHCKSLITTKHDAFIKRSLYYVVSCKDYRCCEKFRLDIAKTVLPKKRPSIDEQKYMEFEITDGMTNNSFATFLCQTLQNKPNIIYALIICKKTKCLSYVAPVPVEKVPISRKRNHHATDEPPANIQTVCKSLNIQTIRKKPYVSQVENNDNSVDVDIVNECEFISCVDSSRKKS